MIDLSSLNDQQREAALHGTGACLVLATAGSGKTRVLTMRAARLIEEDVSPCRILLATFTKKASEEMRSRLARLVGDYQAQAVWVGTFHSHCLRILRITHGELGEQPFEVLPPGRAIWLAKDILGPADSKHPYGMDWETDPRGPLGYISRAKADLVDVDRAEWYFREKTDLGPNLGLYVDFWHRYELAKKDAHLLDFDDFLLHTYRMFRDNKEALRRWQSSFDYILEDEVQDTMIAQHEIIRMLASGHGNYFAVGDINQSIYGFRGSDPDHTVMSFLRDYDGGKIIKLPINYRSQSAIVERGCRLIRHNSVSQAYTLDPKSHRSEGIDPTVFVSENEDAEAAHIASGIAENLLDGYDYKQIAILYRVNAQSRALEDAMILHEIPYVVHGSAGFYNRKEVRECLSYLQLAQNPRVEASNDALRVVINIPSTWFGGYEKKASHFLGRSFITTLERTAQRNGCCLFDALDRGAWKEWQWNAIEDFKEIVDSVRAAGPRPKDMLESVRECCYDAHLARESGEDDESGADGTRSEVLDELVSASEKFENAAAFLDFVTQQQSKAKKLAKDQDAVQLLTIHRSKGLEWPVVYLCGLSMGLLPHERSVQWFDPEYKKHIIPESIEEERRLCYVAVTRAMDELRMSALITYHHNNLSASPFLSEMGYPVPAEYSKHAADVLHIEQLTD